MKNQFKNYFNKGGLAIALLMIVCAIFGVMDGSVLAAAGNAVTGSYIPQNPELAPPSTTGTEAGIQIPGQVLTPENVNDVTDQILLADVQKAITEFRPYLTPLYTLMSNVQQRPTNSLQVKWGSNDVKPISTTLTNAYTAASAQTAVLTVGNAMLFAKRSTIKVGGVYGYDLATGTVLSTTQNLQLLVTAVNYGAQQITVMAQNGPRSTPNSQPTVPSIPASTTLYRLGRAHGSLEIQTDPYNAIPTFEQNYVQSFKCQIEIGKWFEKSKKTVEWDEKDVEDSAIFEFKREMESSFIDGAQTKVRDSTDSSNPQDILTGNGISAYILSQYEYTTFDKNDLILMTEQAFTGNTGSPERVLLAGSGLLANMSKIDYTNFKDISKNVETIWNLKFTTFTTVFGQVNAIHMPILDELGETNNGYLVDPQFLYKYTFEAENKKVIDKVSAGISNVDANVTTEVSCIGVAYPACHLKVVYTTGLPAA